MTGAGPRPLRAERPLPCCWGGGAVTWEQSRGRGGAGGSLFHALPDSQGAVLCGRCSTGRHALPPGFKPQERDACRHTVGASSQRVDPPRGARGQDAAPVTAAPQPAFRGRANRTRPQGSRAPSCPSGRQLGAVTSSQSRGQRGTGRSSSPRPRVRPPPLPSLPPGPVASTATLGSPESASGLLFLKCIY